MQFSPLLSGNLRGKGKETKGATREQGWLKVIKRFFPLSFPPGLPTPNTEIERGGKVATAVLYSIYCA